MFDDKMPVCTPLEQIGEFSLIKHLTRDLVSRQVSTVKSVGDDAAILEFSKEQLLISTDMLLEGIHFNLAYNPLKHLGYKSVVVNLSDIYAMNARPTQITLSLAISNRFSLESLEEFYEGVKLACEHYQVDLVGGDTSSSRLGMFISVTVIGATDKKDIVFRKGAQPGDLLVVSGDLGAAYMGLQILEREHKVFKVNPHMQPELKGYEYLIERQLKPEARKEVFDLFKSMNIKPTSMIDISDGLASEILHLCDQSDLGCKLFEDRIPIDPQTILACEEFKMHPAIAALSGGEDYELLFTLALKDYEKIKDQPLLKIIGHMTSPEEGAQILTQYGTSTSITAQGWDAFLKKSTF
ncbi:thiamine-phosphate kinase [Bacteroidetes bacterium endosymbiont of Geopemphigus sp.]|uniref:thiamine-phosphate kinase n=1 Tax=Bacteroidetes bacterium endosymbiont of Geopemphigus sp. TaxID=2047937 RepID=UPI000CD16C7B|nr:thiamine-phosphate kinase [Bacteroidetes bacterium endosymbiont of Geopemphigus sp.]